ncbi:hypothetical protein JTE90_020497 [Oedothorax gibbosus]|uniref:Uncharacterized protein n=1 Tax=Oedothorax gibbosus TaxID=931172 RepID=A0AAV6USS3_9ARAC|nr:hypothetical protein JTE90_020497 [Oedothorax gibbosus]
MITKRMALAFFGGKSTLQHDLYITSIYNKRLVQISTKIHPNPNENRVKEPLVCTQEQSYRLTLFRTLKDGAFRGVGVSSPHPRKRHSRGLFNGVARDGKMSPIFQPSCR